MLKNGVSGREIAKQLGVSEGHVSNVKKAYAEKGIEGIKPKHEGRKTGEKRILSPEQEKVFLILYNLRVNHSIKVQEWLAAHKEKIEVFYLPPYAPEYNPDELVNSDLKRSVGAKTSPRSEKELEHNVRSHLKTIQNNSAKIASFFHAPFTAYAA